MTSAEGGRGFRQNPILEVLRNLFGMLCFKVFGEFYGTLHLGLFIARLAAGGQVISTESVFSAMLFTQTLCVNLVPSHLCVSAS